MTKKEEKSLDELVQEAETSWGKQTPQFISLREFETKIKRIARAFGGETKIQAHGSHKDIRIEGQRVGWSVRQRGDEEVLSSGTFENAIERTSEATGIPYNRLILYFKGRGKPYRRYKSKFEEEYGV